MSAPVDLMVEPLDTVDDSEEEEIGEIYFEVEGGLSEPAPSEAFATQLRRKPPRIRPRRPSSQALQAAAQLPEIKMPPTRVMRRR